MGNDLDPERTSITRTNLTDISCTQTFLAKSLELLLSKYLRLMLDSYLVVALTSIVVM